MANKLVQLKDGDNYVFSKSLGESIITKSTSNLTSLLYSVDDSSFNIHFVKQNATDSPNVYASGIVFTFRQGSSDGWQITVLNGTVYRRTLESGTLGSWATLTWN